MFILIAVISLLIKESLLLRIVKVTVPSYRVRGQPAPLDCDYELGDDTLYSVKWYRDNEEFYRYMPKYDPPKLWYKLDGVKVDLPKSDDRRVVLHPVTLKSSGLYRCEVSAEAPSFASSAGEGRMEVIYLPREGPRITGNEQENKRGDSLFLNCTSGRSYPAAILSWDIDGEKVQTSVLLNEEAMEVVESTVFLGITVDAKLKWGSHIARLDSKLSSADFAVKEIRSLTDEATAKLVSDPALLVEYPPIQHSHGLLSTALGLRVPTGRTMQVKCTARVAPAWREGSEAVVGNSQLADSKEAMLLVRSSSAASTLSVTLLTLSLLRLPCSLIQET